jgi:hypothetical protein
MGARTRVRLPIEPERLKKEFPELDAEEVDAYVTVTRRVLAKPEARSRALREVVAKADEAQRRAASGERLKAEDALLLRYLSALSKMQRSTVPGRKPDKS